MEKEDVILYENLKMNKNSLKQDIDYIMECL